MIPIRFQPADQLSLALFSLLAATMLAGLIYWMLRSLVPRRWIDGYLMITVLFSVFAISGLTRLHPLPIAPLLMIGMLVFGIAFAFSKAGDQLSSQTPLFALVAFQGFRLPLELLLHHWSSTGTVPATMTWTGSNWDLLAGLVALLFAPLVTRSPKMAWIPQLIGFGLLLNVLRVVIMSSPFPFSWELENPLQLIFYFPYVLIGPVMVLPALVGHLLVFRKLLRGQSRYLVQD